jgi:hypothetical protein
LDFEIRLSLSGLLDGLFKRTWLAGFSTGTWISVSTGTWIRVSQVKLDYVLGLTGIYNKNRS